MTPPLAPRALGLVRVSKERHEMLSPTLQRTAIGDYAAARGYTVVDWLEGVDESGSSARSAWWARLDQACTAVEARQVDVVLVWKFSRVARNRLRWAVAVDRVEAAGGRLESATEQVDTSTSTGRFTRGMLAELQSFEAERIGEQWRETHAHRRAAGLPHDGSPRLGYTYARGGGYSPDPAVAPVVADLYARYTAGSGYRPLRDHLDALAITQPRTGRAWTSRGVALYLQSGFAAGLLSVHDPACSCGRPAGCVRRVHVPAAHQPIITAGAWAEYQHVRAARAGTSPRRLGSPHVLSGLVRCAGCGYALRVRPQTAHRRQRLDCPTHRCPAPAGTPYARVLDDVLAWLDEHPQETAQVVQEALARRARPAAPEVTAAHLHRVITRADAALHRLTTGLARGIVDENAYAAARDELTAEKDRAAQALEDTEQAATATPHEPGAGAWGDLSTVEQRDALAGLCEVVVTRQRPGPAGVTVRPRQRPP